MRSCASVQFDTQQNATAKSSFPFKEHPSLFQGEVLCGILFLGPYNVESHVLGLVLLNEFT